MNINMHFRKYFYFLFALLTFSLVADAQTKKRKPKKHHVTHVKKVNLSSKSESTDSASAVAKKKTKVLGVLKEKSFKRPDSSKK